MSINYKIVAFDLDGTLAKSKLSIDATMAELLYKLSLEAKVVVISGGSLIQFKEQLIPFLKSSKNVILLPANGTERYEYDDSNKKWKMTDRKDFSEDIKKQVTKVLDEIISSGKYDIPIVHSGDYVEDRGTEITFSALGQNADLREKSLWDPNQKKRLKIKKEIERQISNVTVGVAGTTSIDILSKGFDKARGLEILLDKFNLTKKDILFVGDAVFPGGNDYTPYKAGIKTIKTSSHIYTEEIIKKILDGKDIIEKHKEYNVEENIEKNEEKKDLKGVVEKVVTENHFPENPVAYFCAEYAMIDDPTMYAGGLGVLAADYIMEIAEQNMPFVAIGLNYDPLSSDTFSIFAKDGKPLIISIPIENEMIYAQVWHHAFTKNTHMFLLDTDIKENNDENKKISSHLYSPNFYTRIKQQMVLGIGGIRLLEKLNISPSIYHLNEGHTAFAGVAILLERKKDLGKIVASKHTILSAAGVMIPKKDLCMFLESYCKSFSTDVMDIYKKGEFELDHDMFSTTKFVMNISQRKNGVSALHVVFEKKVHPHSELIAITNGVYKKRWQARELLSRSVTISDEEFWNIRKDLKTRFISYVKETTGKKLNPEICTVVWARRFASYKRPFLIFSDLERIIKIISSPESPVQFVIAGKANETDTVGQEIIKKIVDISEDPKTKGRIVYIPNYSINIAKELVKGADVWLNTPERGKEACGTSGMKASLNGALQLSISDGWVDEVNLEGKGWILPEENTAQVLYDLLEQEVLPSFYTQSEDGIPHEWIQKMRQTIEIVEKSYTTVKMLENYRKDLYRL